MNRSITLTRAALRAALPALGTATIGFAVLAGACPAQAFTPSSKAGGEATPLNLAPAAGGGAHASSGGASIVRTIVGLLIVIAVIWGLTWILKQVKSGRERSGGAGTGLSSLATLPLGSGRSVHLVRAGRDYLLVGSAEHGVAPIHRYTEEQAQDAGLLDLVDPDTGGDPGAGGPSSAARALVQSVIGKARQTSAGRPPGAGQPRSPGQSTGVTGPRPVDLGVGSGIIERLREWTVRR